MNSKVSITSGKLISRFPITEIIESQNLTSKLSITEISCASRFRLPVSECNDYNYMSYRSKIPISEESFYVFTNKTSKLSITEEILPKVVRQFSKLALRESLIGVRSRVPVTESATVIIGIIMTENIMSKMVTGLSLHEHIRSRILYDLEVLDRGHIKVKWYGESVPYVCIYKKNLVDLAYPSNPLATVRWAVGEYIITIDDTSCNIKLLGLNNTGESGEFNIGESNMIDMMMNTKLPLNEKTYFIDVNYTSVYRFDVNY